MGHAFKTFPEGLQFNQEGELVYWNSLVFFFFFVIGIVFNFIIFAYFTESKLCIGSGKVQV